MAMGLVLSVKVTRGQNSREELGLTTLDQRELSFDQRLSDVVSALGHEAQLLHTPDTILSDEFADVGHSEHGEHWVLISNVSQKVLVTTHCPTQSEPC